MNRKILAAPYLVWILGFTVIPLLFILGKAFTTGDGTVTMQNLTAIASPIHRKALLFSLQIALICTCICVVLAYPLALILRLSKMSQKNMILFVLILPMWMNFILRIMALQILISNNGVINMILEKMGISPVHIANTPAAIILGMVYDFLPYMILPVLNSILSIDQDLIEAARDLGAGRRQLFFRIILPLSLPGVGSGVTMVFVPSMTAFVVSNILGGGKIQLLGNVIEQEFMVSMDWNLGSGLSVALMLFIFLMSFLFGNNRDSEDKRKLIW